MNAFENSARFMRLFKGYDKAFGHGGGGWIKRPLRPEDWLDHLEGRGRGLGIGPLREDGSVLFAAIDLDEPNFDLARDFQQWIPGPSFIERSRSGNAHVWVFFDSPCAAWVATGLLKYAIDSAGAKHVEVFPKQTSFNNVSLGNYINLPYHGTDRAILYGLREAGTGKFKTMTWQEYKLEEFLDEAEANLNSPAAWEKRATWLMIDDPATKKREGGTASEFGTQDTLHMCAEYVFDGVMSGERPIMQGHKSVVYFNLAKQLANCSLWDHDEALEILTSLNDASPDKANMAEVARFLRNAYEKQYTSTGCDDPVFGPYAHPDCPIAHPRR